MCYFVGNTLSPSNAGPSDEDELSGSVWRDSLIDTKAVTDIHCVHPANPDFSINLEAPSVDRNAFPIWP